MLQKQKTMVLDNTISFELPINFANTFHDLLTPKEFFIMSFLFAKERSQLWENDILISKKALCDAVPFLLEQELNKSLKRLSLFGFINVFSNFDITLIGLTNTSKEFVEYI